ncbi:hypothetical protein H6F51_05040 [Cyanobacteria bacterium FACHB-DQ100]|uniref:hypothetical protein n=1 Tax=Leptolyngbya sp. DQ-M1 TaxID=2933920 RepID=UPI00198EDB87|nr:hypothetical protein [Cyanobacteria bacterium FACHB-DQ100]
MAAKGEPVSKGFAVGLQIWLLFLISFYGLGYPALFSILLGALGGLASGFIVDWWLTKDENIEPRKRRSDEGVEQQTRSRKRQRPNSALNHRKRRREREPVTLKTVANFFQRPQPANRDEDS